MNKKLDTLHNLLSKQTIGMMDMFDVNGGTNYPPYNIIEVSDDVYHIELAVAGFSVDEMEVSVDGQRLTIESQSADEDAKTYYHKGISKRDFKRQFTMGQYVEVEEVDYTDGILKVILVRNVPDEKKPRSIKINAS